MNLHSHQNSIVVHDTHHLQNSHTDVVLLNDYLVHGVLHPAKLILIYPRFADLENTSSLYHYHQTDKVAHVMLLGSCQHVGAEGPLLRAGRSTSKMLCPGYGYHLSVQTHSFS